MAFQLLSVYSHKAEETHVLCLSHYLVFHKSLFNDPLFSGGHKSGCEYFVQTNEMLPKSKLEAIYLF